jgi:hypothetical protein
VIGLDALLERNPGWEPERGQPCLVDREPATLLAGLERTAVVVFSGREPKVVALGRVEVLPDLLLIPRWRASKESHDWHVRHQRRLGVR